MSGSRILGNVPRREIIGALLTPEEAAKWFGVSVKTLQRWDRAGKLHPVRTLGGHRRFLESEILALREQAVVTAPVVGPDEAF